MKETQSMKAVLWKQFSHVMEELESKGDKSRVELDLN